MKKLVCLLLSLLLALSAFSALALDFPENLGNEATFESLEEAEANAPAFLQAAYDNPDRAYVKNPVLDGYPEGTTWIYRSPKLYGGSTAACKLNSTVAVFASVHFEDKASAKAFLDDLGILPQIDALIGSIVLVTPAGDAFGEADAAAFAALQTAYLAQQASSRTDDGTVYFPEGEYFGCYGEQYVIGLGEGASFVHDFIATDEAIAGTIAGLLLIDGDMAADAQVATAIPAYLVGAGEGTVKKYKAACGVDESAQADGLTCFYRASKPALKVIAAESGKEWADYVESGFEKLFETVMRLSATGGSIPYSIVNR